MVAIHMDRSAGPQATFRIGRVISKATSIYVNNFVFLNLIFLVILLGAQGINYLARPYLPHPGQVSPAPGQFVLSLAITFGFMMVYMAAVAVATQIVFQYLREGRAEFGAVFAQGLARAPAMIGVGFLSMLAVVVVASLIGGILAAIDFSIWQFDAQEIANRRIPSDPATIMRLAGIVLIAGTPALYLITMWHVSTPACVAEELGPIRSLGRSRTMTKGFRWRVAALVVFGIIVSMLPKAVAFAAGAAVQEWPMFVVVFALTVLITSYLCALPCAAFVDLHQAKEGRDIQKVANVFD